MKRYAAARVGRDAVDDIVNATFTTAWQRLHDIPPDAALPWLLGTCRNHCRNQHRSQRRFAALVDEIAAARPRIETDLDAHGVPPEAVDTLQRALRTMSASNREIFVLSAWIEMTPTEIGAITGLRAGAVRKRLHGMRQTLGSLFGNDRATQGDVDD